ncbi:hypothetical protein MTR67_041314 [Solanum verrucosum]|uniref:HR-like lesion-inducer n=1 Tax=Solanum verrucosum TaxID=315347 RepID=A0AAF0ZT10_SOLVR|nr:uncharacterized protein LOC125839645 [Solanum verrucosum]KAH0640389.1 hypothetical protein KY285_036975 [Solanum tuberosum]WMV47929.1 hypothetical protein MTR67_041314 [Solanum verrucosum]
MAALSFIGRVFFVSVFVLSAYQEFNEFGSDGGPAAKALGPKFNVLSKHVATHIGFELPHVEMKHLILGAIVLKSLGSLLFIFGSSVGALLLLIHQAVASPVLYDFYNYDVDKKEFVQLFFKFSQNLALLGALLFFIGMKNSMPRRSSSSSSKKKGPKAKAN